MRSGFGSFGQAECARLREDLPLHGLDVLEGAEAERVQRHLRHCPACRAEAARLRDLGALLPVALEPCEPPPEVLGELLRRVRATRAPRARKIAARWIGAIAASLMLALLAAPRSAIPLIWTDEVSPDVAVINLFAAIDSPLSARYEYRTAPPVRFDESVGRIYFNTTTGHWRLVVHGLPRPPRGSHYALTTESERGTERLGVLERWEWGVATLEGDAAYDLTHTQRLSLELISPTAQVRLLEAGAH